MHHMLESLSNNGITMLKPNMTSTVVDNASFPN